MGGSVAEVLEPIGASVACNHQGSEFLEESYCTNHEDERTAVDQVLSPVESVAEPTVC